MSARQCKVRHRVGHGSLFLGPDPTPDLHVYNQMMTRTSTSVVELWLLPYTAAFNSHYQ